MNASKKILMCALAAALVVACAGAPPPAAVPAPAAPVAAAGSARSGVYLQNLDKSVRPQDDFYRYVNGQWLTTTSIPSDRSNYGAFSLLEEGAERNLHEILEEATRAQAPAGSDAQKAGDYYASFMDEATVETRGLEPLAGELARIAALASSSDVVRYVGHAQRLGVPQPLAYFVAIDEKNATEYVSTVYQTGLGMPDRDYYLSDDARLKGVREKYQVYVRELLAAAGTPDAARAAEKIFQMELQLAKASWTRVQNRDAEKTYNRYDMAALSQLMPSFDWNAFLAGVNVPAGKVRAVIVAQPSYFEALDRLLATVPVADWRAYLRYKLLNTYAPSLPSKFVQLHFDFTQRTVSGIQEIKPRWKRAVDTVESSIGDLVGKMYVERHFRPEAKQRIDALVSNMMAAYSQGIDQLEWMSPATKQKAHAKLALITRKIGYPERWRDFSQLEVRRDDLVGNEMRAAAVAFDRDTAKLGGPIDKTEWLMTPQTVNAYYNPPANEIVFPAAILQPPFFNVEADDAVNYGAIGAVIGHEISHGFDDQGRRYDGNGNLSDWWAPQDNAEFTRRTQLLGAQYSALSPMPGQHVNGDLTMGENIADLAGLTMAYRAYQISLNGKQAAVLDGFSGDQRFFIGWAQGWARKYRDDELRKRLLTDPHSPSEYRTNAVVANMASFTAAFDVKPGDGMYRAPADRVKIW
jgi:putative endopeptidase